MNLEQKIVQAIGDLQGMILASKYLLTIDKKIAEQEEIIKLLHARMEKESRDIEELEQKSRKILFTKILGYEEEQQEIEKQEFLHAVLMFKDAKESLKPLLFEKNILSEKVEKIESQRELLEKLLVQREKEFIKLGVKKDSRLINIFREIDHLTKFTRELFEAKDVGLKCKRKIEAIISFLEKATEVRNWGQKETGENNYEVEKDLVDEAINEFHELKVLLLKFEEELEDVHEKGKINVFNTTIKFDNFVKAYNNYLINDWVVRKNLSSTLSLIEAMKDDVIRLLNTLNHKQQLTKEKLESNEQEREAIITDTAK